MAKSISISLAHVYTSRGEQESVEDALRWLDKNMSSTDEETGEETIAYTPADLIVYAVRRLRALHKDGKRHGAGKLASRFYGPRVDKLEKVPAVLARAVEAVDEASDKLHPVAKAPTKAKATKTSKRAEQEKAPRAKDRTQHEAERGKGTKAKAPTVRKAQKATADTGGANLPL